MFDHGKETADMVGKSIGITPDDAKDITKGIVSINESQRVAVTPVTSLEAVFLMASDMLAHIDCPECDGSGGFHDGEGNPHQCRWCHHIDLIVAKTKELL